MFNFFLKSPFIQSSERSPILISDQRKRGSPGVWDAVAECDWISVHSSIHPSAIWIPNRTALVAVRADGSYFWRFSVRCRFDMRVWLWDLKCGDIIIFFDVLFPLGEFKFTSVCIALFVCFCFYACSCVSHVKLQTYFPIRRKCVSISQESELNVGALEWVTEILPFESTLTRAWHYYGN